MIVIHQAIYGDKAKGHALLVSSFTDETIPKRLGNSTDVLDRPPNEILLEPIIRGFPLEDYLLIVKSFAHPPGEGIREGRVFSHALFIEKKELSRISDLLPLFSYLIKEPVISESLNLINHDEKVALSISSIPAKGRASFGVKGLVYHSNHLNTVVWVGEDGYFEFVSGVWSGLPKHLRQELSFGAAFDPRKTKGDQLKIVTVPKELVPNWKRYSFYLVEEASEAELTRMSEFYVAGDKLRSSALADLINKFRLDYKQISDLAILENVAGTYQCFKSGTSFNDLVLLADIISKYNPDPKSKIKEKSEILSAIASRVKMGAGKEILALRGAHWKGFHDHEKIIGKSIEEWGVNISNSAPLDETVPKAIATALVKSTKPKWWSRCVQDGIIEGFRNWRPAYANVLWGWIKIDSSLSSFLDIIAEKGIPYEIDLLDHLPDFDNIILTEVVDLCKRQDWLQLHAVCLSRIFNAAKAIPKQLEVDIDLNHEDALRRIASIVTTEDFVLAATEIGEPRTLNIASEIVTDRRSILGLMDIGNENWRSVWLASISATNVVWNGIPAPRETLFELLEILLSGQKIEKELLIRVSGSEFNDLTQFPNRSDVWSTLPANARSQFLTATALNCVLEIEKGSVAIEELENPIQGQISKEYTFREIATSKKIGAATKIALFSTLPSLSDFQLLTVLENNRFDKIESQEVGLLIRKRSWENAARFLHKNVTRRPDFKIALSQCFSILSLWERLSIDFWGHANDTIGKSEWFEAFTECCSDLLSKGPSQNGIWETCGGRDADLLTNSTGRDTWLHAINQVRNGTAGVKLKRLLKELRKEFPNNQKLKMLEGTRS